MSGNELTAAEQCSLIKMAREAVPDYPWDPKHPLPLREAVWALVQSIEGLNLACDDLHKVIDKMQADVDRLRSGATSESCVEEKANG